MDQPHELLITERRRTSANSSASLADFVLTAGAAVEAEWLVQNPQVTLHTLDAASSQAIFVELAPEVNLSAAPFVYQAQYEGAKRLFAMPYADFLEIGERLAAKLDRLTLLFNISRCGSTLLHQTFNQVPGVVSLSEPDGFSPFWSEESRPPDGEAIALMKAAANFLFRPQHYPDLAMAVIKFRGRSLRLLDLCYAAFPQATFLFLYRDAVSWAASWACVEVNLARNTRLDRTPLDDHLAFLASHLGPLSFAERGIDNLPGSLSRAQRRALVWLALVDYYLQRTEKGPPITAWRYADLNQRRQETLTHLFATCGLPPAAVTLALAGFERDSQAGTVMAREEGSQGNAVRLSDEEVEEIRAIVRCHPVIQTPDFVVPGTFQVS